MSLELNGSSGSSMAVMHTTLATFLFALSGWYIFI